jgi:predicted nucleic acid-binding protein
MTGRIQSEFVFVDSTIWLYGLMTDPAADATEETRKRSIATRLINSENIVISTQIINEVCAVLNKEAKFSEEQIKQIIQEFYAGCVVIEPWLDTLMGASNLRLRYRFSFWDSLIVASALEANAIILYSATMQDGLIVNDSLRIDNPLKRPIAP